MNTSAYRNVSVDFALSLGARVDVVVSHFTSKAAAAQVAELSVEQLTRIIEGIASPHAITLARLACSASIDLNWLLTGEGALNRAWPDVVTNSLWRDGAL